VDARTGRRPKVDYHVEKTIEYGLEEAARLQKRAELIAEARGGEAVRPGILRSLFEPFTDWARRATEVRYDVRRLLANAEATNRRSECADAPERRWHRESD
jgi:hypothetical protein